MTLHAKETGFAIGHGDDFVQQGIGGRIDSEAAFIDSGAGVSQIAA